MGLKNEYVFAIVLAALIFVSALQTVQLLGLKSNISGGAASGGAASETYEQMMQRMHGSSGSTPAAAASSSPRQVGSC